MKVDQFLDRTNHNGINTKDDQLDTIRSCAATCVCVTGKISGTDRIIRTFDDRA